MLQEEFQNGVKEDNGVKLFHISTYMNKIFFKLKFHRNRKTGRLIVTPKGWELGAMVNEQSFL